MNMFFCKKRLPDGRRQVRILCFTFTYEAKGKRYKTYWDWHQKRYGKKFYSAGYLFLHPDVAKIGVHPWKHYWTQGRKAGYTMGWPSQEEFSADDYYAQNPDVKEAGYDAWKHYVEHGKSEHRLLTPPSNEKCTSLIEAGQIDPSTISFSIIMPTWNRADCIQRSINSILDQTWQNFELIIADDGSDDNTEELIYEKYGKEIKAGKIKYLKLQHNGVCLTRNAGLKAASNDWIAYADSDNFMTPQALSIFASAINENPHTLVFYGQMKRMCRGNILGRSFSFEALMTGNYIDMGMLVHHALLPTAQGGFNEQLHRLVDWELVLRYSLISPPVYIKQVVLLYDDSERTDRISVSASYEKAEYFVKKLHFAKKIRTVIIANNDKDTVRQAIESALMQRGEIVNTILLFDNASTDGTEKICSDYASRNPEKIQLVRLGAPSSNHELLLRSIVDCDEFDYLSVLNANDYWVDDLRLHKLAHQLYTTPESTAIFNACRTYHKRTLQFTQPSAQRLFPEKITNPSYFRLGDTSLSSCMFKVDCFNVGAPTESFANVETMLQSCLCGGPILFNKEVLTVSQNDNI